MSTVVSATQDVIFVCDVNGDPPVTPYRGFIVNSQTTSPANEIFKIAESPSNPVMTVTGDIYRSASHVIDERSGASSIVLFQSGTTTKASIKSSGLGVFDYASGTSIGGVKLKVRTAAPSSATDKGHLLIYCTSDYRLYLQTCQGAAAWKWVAW